MVTIIVIACVAAGLVSAYQARQAAALPAGADRRTSRIVVPAGFAVLILLTALSILVF